MAALASAHGTLPRLTMRGIRKAFGSTAALAGVDLEVYAGEVHGLIGENGAGKSTLMKVLSGAVKPDAGAVTLDGSPFVPRNTEEARAAGIAMIYQELSLAPHLSVVDNILLGIEDCRYGFLRPANGRTKAQEALEQLGRGEILLDSPVSRLAVAEQQIVEIARALVTGCRVLVLDEPTSSLTAADTEHLFLVIRRLRSQGKAIIYISHFLEELKQVADRFTVLRDGLSAGSGSAAECTVQQIVEMMVGRQIDQLFPRSDRVRGEPILEIRDLAGAGKLLEAGLTLHRGEILGIAGLLGAGRTELLRLIFGLEPVRRGSIRIGRWHGTASPERRWMQGCGFLSEDRAREGLAVWMSIADNVTMNLGRDTGFAGVLSPTRLEAASSRWISALGIRTSGPRQRVAALSGGNQQKVAIARLLHQEVDIMLLDEPTRGIDVASKLQLYDLINRFAVGGPDIPPRAVLLVSSYFPELLGMCDRIAVICRGRLGPAYPVAEYTQQRLMAEAIAPAR